MILLLFVELLYLVRVLLIDLQEKFRGDLLALLLYLLGIRLELLQLVVKIRTYASTGTAQERVHISL